MGFSSISRHSETPSRNRIKNRTKSGGFEMKLKMESIWQRGTDSFGSALTLRVMCNSSIERITIGTRFVPPSTWTKPTIPSCVHADTHTYARAGGTDLRRR